MVARTMRRVAILALALAVCLCWAAFAETDTQKLGNIGRIRGDDTSSEGDQGSSSVQWTVADAGQGDAPAEPREWTIMVYVCGSDLGMSAKADMEEMATSGFDESRINVVVYTGGAKFWGGAKIPTDMLAMQEIHNGVVKQVDAFPLADMSVSETLNRFLTVAPQRYPAEKYALILWDHGGGPNSGMFLDMLFGADPMPLDELKQAIGDSPFGSSQLEFIGFDACLMGGVEVAGAMAPYARYMLASEESEPGLGWNYAFLGAMGPQTSVEEIARNVIDDYFESIEQKSPGQVGRNTMSCIDLSRMESVEASCAAFFKDMDSMLSSDTYATFAKARDKAIYFGDTKHDLVDIGSFAKNLDVGEPESLKKLLDALDGAVVHNRSDTGKTFGLSIYHPYCAGSIFYANKGEYENLSPCPEYSSYIDHFTQYLTGRAQADWSSISTLGHIKSADQVQRDMNTNFTLKLTKEQIDFMAEVELEVFESQDGGASCALVSRIPDVYIGEDNTITAAYVHRTLFITEDGSGVRSPALPYDLAGDGLYSVEGTLVGKDAGGNEVRQPVRLLYALNEVDDYDGTLELRQIEVLDARDGTYTARHNVDPADFDSLEIVRELRSPTTLDGATLNGYDQWETVGTEVCAMPLEDGWSLKMLHDVLDPNDLYVGFGIRDYQNRRYTSALIARQEPLPEAFGLTYDDKYLSVFMSVPTLETGSAWQGMGLSIRVANHSGVADALLRVSNLRVNGQPIGLTQDIYGKGPNEGLLIDEEEVAMLRIPAEALKGMGTVETLDYDILVLDASNGDSEVYAVPVHAELSIDVSAFH